MCILYICIKKDYGGLSLYMVWRNIVIMNVCWRTLIPC